MTRDELQDNISCIKHIAEDKQNSDSIKNPSHAFWVAGLAIEVIEELQKRIKRAKLKTSCGRCKQPKFRKFLTNLLTNNSCSHNLKKE